MAKKRSYSSGNLVDRATLDGDPKKHPKSSGWNTALNRSANLSHDLKSNRVKHPTTSLFYYASGEARKIRNNDTGNLVSVKTLQGKTGGMSSRKNPMNALRSL